MAAFQILAEARGRMLRSTFARVLLEMALVQISLLEDLSAISGLLSGNLPKLPAATSIETSDSVQKKTADLSGSSDPQQTSSEKSTPTVPFNTDSSDVLLSQLVSATPFTVSAALKAAECIAISEPNTVELLLNSSLEFQKKVLETPEHRSTIQQLIEQFTGVQAVISIRSVQMAAPAAAKVPPSEAGGSPSNRQASSETDQPQAPMVRNDIDPRLDAFVQEVVDVFGARVDRVINAPIKRRAE